MIKFSKHVTKNPVILVCRTGRSDRLSVLRLAEGEPVCRQAGPTPPVRRLAGFCPNVLRALRQDATPLAETDFNRRKKMVKHSKFAIFGFMTTLIISGCATFKATLYDQSKLKTVTSWNIDFSYEAGELEEKVTNGKEAEVKVTKAGHLPRDLQLRDDIFFHLKDKYHIPVVKDVNSASGFIRIHPVHFYLGGFKSLDVTIYDRENNLIARVRVKNGDRSTTFKKDDEFAEYCADAIAKSMLAQQ